MFFNPDPYVTKSFLVRVNGDVIEVTKGIARQREMELTSPFISPVIKYEFDVRDEPICHKIEYKKTTVDEKDIIDLIKSEYLKE